MPDLPHYDAVDRLLASVAETEKQAATYVELYGDISALRPALLQAVVQIANDQPEPVERAVLLAALTVVLTDIARAVLPPDYCPTFGRQCADVIADMLGAEP